MIRLFFVGFVILGGFTAIALMNARRGDPQVVAEQIAAGEPAQTSRPVITEATSTVERPREQRAPAIAPAEPAAPAKPATPVARVARVAQVALELRDAIAAAAAAPRDDRDPATIGADETPTAEIADDDTEVVVEEIVPLAEFGGGFRPSGDGVVETSGEFAPQRQELAPQPDPDVAASPHDSDRSADLIRRMLAVYRGARANR